MISHHVRIHQQEVEASNSGRDRRPKKLPKIASQCLKTLVQFTLFPIKLGRTIALEHFLSYSSSICQHMYTNYKFGAEHGRYRSMIPQLAVLRDESALIRRR